MNAVQTVTSTGYTADDFIRSAEEAVRDMSPIEKEVSLGFARAIAGDAAEHAKTMHVEKEFEFNPGRGKGTKND